MSERLAMLPLAVIAIVGAGLVLVYAGQELGKWLIRVSERRKQAKSRARQESRS